MKRLIPLPVILLAMLVAPTAVLAQEQHAQAELLANVSKVKPGEPFMLGIRFKIDPQWHIYWTNPGDSGLATEVRLKLPAGFTAGPVQYPVPRRLALPGDVINYAYEDDVMLLVQVTPPKDLADKTVTIGGKATWLVCKDDCMPGSGKLSLDLAVGDSAAADNADLFKTWAGQLPIPTSTDIQGIENTFKKGSKDAGDNVCITIRWNGPARDVEYLPDVVKGGDISNIEIAKSGSTTSITFTVKGETDNVPMPGLVVYTDKSGERVGVKTMSSASESR